MEGTPRVELWPCGACGCDLFDHVWSAEGGRCLRPGCTCPAWREGEPPCFECSRLLPCLPHTCIDCGGRCGDIPHGAPGGAACKAS